MASVAWVWVWLCAWMQLLYRTALRPTRWRVAKNKRGFSVSKSYVARVLAANADVVIALRRQMRNRRTCSRDESRNRLWAMDLSYLGDGDVDVELGADEQTVGGEVVAVSTSGCAIKRLPANAAVRQRIILGIVDHGTRACIALSELANKSSAAIRRSC